MSSYSDQDRALALAGVFQGAFLANELAWKGKAAQDAFAASLESIFLTNPDSVAEVFSGISGVATGLKQLARILDDPIDRNEQETRYVSNVLALARKIKADSKLSSQLGEDISKLKNRSLGFDFDLGARAAQVANIYQNRISPLSPRILVKGEPIHLQNEAVAARIRTALLAGIRAAHLWMQCGGTRWQLIWQRKRLLNACQGLIIQADSNQGASQ